MEFVVSYDTPRNTSSERYFLSVFFKSKCATNVEGAGFPFEIFNFPSTYCPERVLNEQGHHNITCDRIVVLVQGQQSLHRQRVSLCLHTTTRVNILLPQEYTIEVLTIGKYCNYEHEIECCMKYTGTISRESCLYISYQLC